MQMGYPSFFLPIVPGNLYKKGKILSPGVYPFRKMAWFNMALQKSKVQLAPTTGNICGV